MEKKQAVIYGEVYQDETKNKYPLCKLRNTKDKGFYVEIIEAILLLLQDMNRYSRIRVTLFTLMFPKNFNGNQPQTIKDFIRDFPTLLRRSKIHFHYIWVQERSQRDGLHLHIFLIVSGHDLRSIYNLWLLTIYTWHGKLKIPTHSGFVHYNHRSPSLFCERGENYEKQHADAFQWGSYLAKVASKELDTYGRPIWGYSKPKKRNENESIQKNEITNFVR